MPGMSPRSLTNGLQLQPRQLYVIDGNVLPAAGHVNASTECRQRSTASAMPLVMQIPKCSSPPSLRLVLVWTYSHVSCPSMVLCCTSTLERSHAARFASTLSLKPSMCARRSIDTKADEMKGSLVSVTKHAILEVLAIAIAC